MKAVFDPKDFEESKHLAVGACNGLSMQERWEGETPVFADAINALLPPGAIVVDYGCGSGRLAKAILGRNNTVSRLIGVDTSEAQLRLARTYVKDSRFECGPPTVLPQDVDAVIAVYVLQHVPAVDLRGIVERIHAALKPGGVLVFCSSLRRMAVRFDGKGVFDDAFLGVNVISELTRYFRVERGLFSEEQLENTVVGRMVCSNRHPHPALVLSKIAGALKGARQRIEPEAEARALVTAHGVELFGDVPTAAIRSVMRILHALGFEDSYYEEYGRHMRKWGSKFVDIYHLAWYIGARCGPRDVLEIGVRNGLSLAQLLCAHRDLTAIHRIVLCDLFADGSQAQERIRKVCEVLGFPTKCLEFRVGDSKETLPELVSAHSEFDYILVDGGHDRETAVSDLSYAARLVRQGGYVVMDDLSADGCNLLPIWREFCTLHRGRFCFFESLSGKGCGYAQRL